MKKVVLVDDRKSRQEIYSESISNALEHSVLDNIQGEYLISLKAKMNERDTSVFDQYSVIIFHRSFLEQSYRLLLKDYVINTEKYLVLFSGGTPATILNNRILSINSKELYSSRLIDFLDDAENTDKPNLQILAFGKKWKLNLLYTLSDQIQNYLGSIQEIGKSVPLNVLKQRIGYTSSFCQFFPKSKILSSFETISDGKMVNINEELSILLEELANIINVEIHSNEIITN